MELCEELRATGFKANWGMSGTKPKALHLHTIDSLCADLVSGRAISLGEDGQLFALPDERTRSALEWYRKRGHKDWRALVTLSRGEELVDTILSPPPDISPVTERIANAKDRRLTLKKIEAHRFAGLHKFVMPDGVPENYVQEFSAPITLFEGANGSGKTSLANAIIWALTGEILRPQREPEKASEEFDCWIEAADGSAEKTTHRLTPVTPLPSSSEVRPDQEWVPADTWVELTFEDENGAELPPIRRCQVRTANGKLIETSPDISPLGLDPVGLRIGTLMPGILPLVRLGSQSELGKAVAQLTGLSQLTDLADHVRRAKRKIDEEFVRAKKQERKSADESYERARADLTAEIEAHPEIKPPAYVSTLSADESVEKALDGIAAHFETVRADTLSSAKSFLGEQFDPSDPGLRADLERNIAPALSEVKQLRRLKSMSRLASLRELSDDDLAVARAQMTEAIDAAKYLQALAEEPTAAARARLYAHVAMWLSEHPEHGPIEDVCVICGGKLEGLIDPATGRGIKEHIHEAREDALLVSQTLARWSAATLSHLKHNLPVALQSELNVVLPDHPCDLIRNAFVEELFETDPFKGVLSKLRSGVANALDRTVADRPRLEPKLEFSLPDECRQLTTALRRLDHALRFAVWRRANDEFARNVWERVIGRHSDFGESLAENSLTAILKVLEAAVKAAAPTTRALMACSRLKSDLRKRRTADKRLQEYEVASVALGNLLQLGDLADRQVEELRVRLRLEAAKWRDRIYLGAFPGTAHGLVDAPMSPRGELEIVIGSHGVSAPAQHVANASALRASLVGFYLAFWEYVLNDRGGLRLLLFDDPQELLDEENRERLASALDNLCEAGAQVIVTTCDSRFARHITRLSGRSIGHYSVHPATDIQPVIRTPLSVAGIVALRKAFEANKDSEETARSLVSECRIFIEARLGDLFDDPAYSNWARKNPGPSLVDYLNRLRALTRDLAPGMFSRDLFKRFANHPGLADGSRLMALLNQAHHGERHLIMPAEVAQCKDQLDELVEFADQMHEECRRWRQRGSDQTYVVAAPSTSSIAAFEVPGVRIAICPDLAAFTYYAPPTESQEPVEYLDVKVFTSKALYYLRRDNFGFAAPKASIVIVEADSLPVADRRLVIARHGDNIYARRLLRSSGADVVGLTAETPDPRRSPRSLFIREGELYLHQVVGVLLVHGISIGPGNEEAVQVNDAALLRSIEVAYRVVEESAVPLALPKQIALGGRQIDLDRLSEHEGDLVALTLENGSSIFKRIGASLSGDLSHMRHFETIGGLGSSEILSVGRPCPGTQTVMSARLIVGILYRG